MLLSKVLINISGCLKTGRRGVGALGGYGWGSGVRGYTEFYRALFNWTLYENATNQRGTDYVYDYTYRQR